MNRTHVVPQTPPAMMATSTLSHRRRRGLRPTSTASPAKARRSTAARPSSINSAIEAGSSVALSSTQPAQPARAPTTTPARDTGVSPLLAARCPRRAPCGPAPAGPWAGRGRSGECARIPARPRRGRPPSRMRVQAEAGLQIARVLAQDRPPLVHRLIVLLGPRVGHWQRLDATLSHDIVMISLDGRSPWRRW
jgi:hypothetical protein